MTSRREILRVSNISDPDIEALRARDEDGSEATVVILKVFPTPVPTDDDFTRFLRSPKLISIGIAEGSLSDSSARIILACDFVVAHVNSEWVNARDAVTVAISYRLPYGTLDRLDFDVLPITPELLHSLGIITELATDTMASSEQLALEISIVPSGSLIGTKLMIDDALGTTLDEALALESDLQTERLMSEEHRRIVEEMRTPQS